MVEAIWALLAADHEAGTIRPGVTADGFILALAGLWQVDARGGWQAGSARLLDLVTDGLRAGAPGKARYRACHCRRLRGGPAAAADRAGGATPTKWATVRRNATYRTGVGQLHRPVEITVSSTGCCGNGPPRAPSRGCRRRS
ncbi:hypothetical protein [Streptomyces canus]|uniref:SbtR family transcriptional regulator n=1 Tax=Streptomyces canus TaxID=58343 RepID=UPI003870BD3E